MRCCDCEFKEDCPLNISHVVFNPLSTFESCNFRDKKLYFLIEEKNKKTQSSIDKLKCKK